MINEETLTEAKKEKEISFFEKVSLVSFLGIIFLLPIFFLPGSMFQWSKGLIFSVMVLVGAIFFILERLKTGVIYFPRHVFYVSLMLIPLVFFLSSILSKSPSASLFGSGFEIGTFVWIFLSAILTILAVELLNAKNRVFYFYLAFFASFFVIALYQILRLIFGPDFLSFGVFVSTSSNLLGKWNELGIYFGLTAILSLVTIETFRRNTFLKYMGILMLVISLFFLVIINFFSVWVFLAIFALIPTVYLFFYARKNTSFSVEEDDTADITIKKEEVKKRRFSIVFLAVFVISLFFALNDFQYRKNPEKSVGAKVSGFFDISQIEVRPSFESTRGIFKDTMKTDPFFGSGPNRFINQWILNKPDMVNSTLFWNTNFDFGVGIIPTYFVTTGLAGALAWVLFFIVFLWMGFKALFSIKKDVFTQYSAGVSFLAAFYLWVYQIFYVPSHFISAMAFVFTGVFVAVLIEAKLIPQAKIAYTADSKKSFVSVLFLIMFIGINLTIGYFIGQKFISGMYANAAIEALNEKGDADKAESYLLKAIGMNKEDEYYRALTELYIYNMNVILAGKDSPEILKNRFEAVLPKAIDSANGAIMADPENYQNYVGLGVVYESVLSLGYKDAYEKAKQAYMEAEKFNPRNPSIILLKARLEAVNNNPQGAKDLIMEALKMKSDYTEAIYLLSQVEVSQKNIKGAIDAVNAVVYLKPNDPTVLFQLGFLKYSDKDYAGAREALSKAISINSSYSNARYFLGLSNYYLGDEDSAIAEFIEIEKLNPDNSEVKLILSNLRGGRAPFQNAKPPVNDTPEKRKQLPISGR